MNPATPRIALRAGRVLDPAHGVDAVQDVFIAEGRIVALGRAPDGFMADLEMDATDLVVAPGLVDLCARLREPGLEHKGSVASETRAAAAAGITTVCCPPDTDPVLDTPAVAEMLRQRAEAAGRARVVALGALTRGLRGEQLAELAALRDAGCVGVSNALVPVTSNLILRRALEYAATFDLTVFLHPLDAALAQDGCAHEGAVSTRLGLPGIPEAAETAALAQMLALVEQTGARTHFCRLSTSRAVRMLGRAQYDGLPVTGDVAAHQLHLTEQDISDFDAVCHVLPPLRTLADRAGLRDGVARGVLAAICSDHQPHEADAKRAPFTETAPGISALETLLALTLRLVEEGVLDLPTAIARVTCGPARILGIEVGTLAPGACADVCVFDPREEWTCTREALLSRGRNTPFHNWSFRGRVRYTLHAGRLVHGTPPTPIADARRRQA